jgi:hypothetical protein
MNDAWHKGAVSPGDDGKRFLVSGPDFLPPSEGGAAGFMKFRLSYMGQDRVTWGSSGPIQFVNPWLEGQAQVC